MIAPAPRIDAATDYEVLIVGAGISGIGMAAHLEMEKGPRRYAILERRDAIGGTWDLFRYPGVRSDSDMHTLGFGFEPWQHDKSIADGEAILEYLRRIARERGIDRNIRFGAKVVSADFSYVTARWAVVFETGEGERKRLTARWLHLGSGYYDYDEPHDPGFDLSAFAGRVVHPQFWPGDLAVSGKWVVVVGSGATAITIVPSVAEQGARVTMLQRTPTWMIGRPSRDRLANGLRRVLPRRIAYAITRWKNVLMQRVFFDRARKRPDRIAGVLTRELRKKLGHAYDETAFTPPYSPWDQRLCLVPDDDFFAALRSGTAQIVTGHIDGFDAGGVRLRDGRHIPADILVTATGLKLAVAGKIAVSVEGVAVDFSRRWYYRGCMFSNLPNFSVVFGYLNASWTLRADLNSAYVIRMLRALDGADAQIAEPVLPPAAEAALEEDAIFDFTSGYIQRARHILPRNAVRFPWRLNQDYVADRKRMKTSPIDDGVLRFSDAGAIGTAPLADAAE